MDLNELLAIADAEKKKQKDIRVHCCTSTGCQAANSLSVKKNLDRAVQESGMSDRVEVVGVGCMGFCGRGPLVQIDPEDTLYEEVTPEDAPSIIDALNGGVAKSIKGDSQHPFFAQQMKVVRQHTGKVDPERIEEYIAVGGYQSLYKAIYERRLQ